MKHRYAAILMGTILSFAVLTGCESSEADVSSSSDSGETIYGEVNKIDGDTITMEVGTLKEDDRGEKQEDGEGDSEKEPEATEEDTDSEKESETDGADTDSEKESEADGADTDSEKESETDGADTDSEKESEDVREMPEDSEKGETPSMLELTGEEKEITVTDDTELTREGGGGFGGGRPEGDMPEKSGDSEDGNPDEAPEKPADAADSEDAEDSTDSEDTEDSTDSEDAEDSADNEDTEDSADSEDTEKSPDAENFGNRSGGKGKPEATEEEISIDDISEGDTIRVTFDEDGKVETITVISGGMRDRGDRQQSTV